MTDIANQDGVPHEAIAEAERWSKRTVAFARSAAERVPAGVALAVGGAMLLALDAFGVGEVLTAGVGAYVAYRMLRRGPRKPDETAR